MQQLMRRMLHGWCLNVIVLALHSVPSAAHAVCRYAWPESPMLQVRVLLCVVLIVLMRLLNLAVPITYKKLVDQLAAATAAGPGDKPSFMELVKPW